MFVHNSKEGKEDEKKCEVTMDIQQLLEVLIDIFIGDIPIEMLSIRNVSHEIDSIPRSILPTKVPY